MAVARMPGARWVGPTPNRNAGGMGAVRGVVLHIQEGSEAGTEQWQKNPSAQVSSHFLAPRAGGVRQMVDTADMAWAQADGNPYWLSIECEGRVPQALTGQQVEACARILAWAHAAYEVPLQSTNSTAGRGLGWHGMGGAAWGGHTGCPGDAIVRQRPSIITRARQIINGEDDDMAVYTSLSLGKEMPAPWDQATTLQWVVENADPQHQHADGRHPGFIPGDDGYVDIDLSVRIHGATRGDEWQLLVQDHTWGSGGSVSVKEELLREGTVTSGDHWADCRRLRYAQDGHHLYLALVVYRKASPEDAAAPVIRSGTLRVRQDKVR